MLGALATTRNPAWAELVQLVPIVSLAFPFIVAGKIDLTRAGNGLLIAALLTIPVSALVLAKRAVLNPILLGTGLWLWVSAIAFVVPLRGLVAWLGETQAFGLFMGVLLVGVATTAWSPQGFIGCRSDDRRWLLRASSLLLLLSAVAVGWSWAFRHNIRAGGGLPFIVLNLARRALQRALPPRSAAS